MQKDVTRLCAAIQALTRHVTSLARVLDFLPEDVNAMHKELEMWRNETRLSATGLQAEERSVRCVVFVNLAV